MLDALGVLQARGAVKKVQYGTVTVVQPALSGTATITAVTIGKAVLIYLGQSYPSGSGTVGVRITLTNSTTVTAVLGVAMALDTTANFVVVEFW